MATYYTHLYADESGKLYTAGQTDQAGSPHQYGRTVNGKAVLSVGRRGSNWKHSRRFKELVSHKVMIAKMFGLFERPSVQHEHSIAIGDYCVNVRDSSPYKQ